MDYASENDTINIDTIGDLAILGFVATIFAMAAYSICLMG